jgi:hypothetical protein
MTHTFMVVAEVTLSFTFGSDDVERLGNDSPSLRSEAASALARELGDLIGHNYAVRSVVVDHEDALLLGSEE